MAYHRTKELLITGPAVEPISVAEAQQHLRLDGQYDADYILSLITAARMELEQVCWSAFITQTWQYWWDRYWWKMFIPRPPFQSVTWIKYVPPGGGALQTLATSFYETSAENQITFIRAQYLQTWPITRGYRDDVTAQVVVGYGPTPGDVPMPIRQAIKLLVAHMYLNRGEAPAELPQAIDRLIAPYRFKEF